MKTKISFFLFALTVFAHSSMAVAGPGPFPGNAPTGTASKSNLPTGSIGPQPIPLNPPAPMQLDAAKFSSRLEQTLKTANLPVQSLVVNNLVRLTPIAPRHPSGAEIKRAGPIMQFMGASSNEHSGSYSLTKSYISSVDMKVPTEPNEVYVLDCQLSPQNQATVIFVRDGHRSYPSVEDGHSLFAFEASSTMTDIMIAFEAPTSVPEGYLVGYFYGCDINEM